MASLVYILCGITSLSCAFLLLRSYRRRRMRLLFWSGACFICLGISNVLLFIDLIVLPDVDLSLVRNCITLAGLLMLLYGMIWDTI